MSLIRQIQELGSQEILDELEGYYQSLFPMEIRNYFAGFLEHRIINAPQLSEDDPQFASLAYTFINDFILEINQKGTEVDSALGQKFFEVTQKLQAMNSRETYSYLIKCINYEQHLIEIDPKTFGNEILTLIGHCSETEGYNFQWDQQFRTFIDENREINYEISQLSSTNCPQSQEILLKIRTESQEMSLNQLKIDRRSIFSKISSCVGSLENASSKLINNYLKTWKWNQKLFGKDLPVCGANLNTMQEWCEHLINGMTKILKIIESFKSYQQEIEQFIPTELHLELGQIECKLISSMKFLIGNAFLLEDQPPQILKANTKFTAKVRFLIGNIIDIKTLKPIVNVLLANEQQAQKVQQNIIPNRFCGKINNDHKCLEINESTQAVTASFSQMKLDTFERAPKKVTESVTDEKFALLFQSSVNIAGIDFKVHELSLPVVITVHGIQETHASATIFWDNSFSSIDRCPFTMPHQVSWKQFSEALSHKFFLELNRGLSDEQLHFFAEKMFNTIVPYPVPETMIVSWTTFCKQPMGSFHFSFWDWLHAALKFLRDHMQKIWEDGFFYGFMRKENIEEKLKASGIPGTFTLRFPDSTPGSISVACLSINDSNYVGHLQPVGANDFGSHSLMDLLNKVEGLGWLYPNMPIQEASQRYARAAVSRQPENRGDGNYITIGMRLFASSRS